MELPVKKMFVKNSHYIVTLTQLFHNFGLFSFNIFHIVLIMIVIIHTLYLIFYALVRKAITILDSALKDRDTTPPTKVHIFKLGIFQ